jgi:hypothetical protein
MNTFRKYEFTPEQWATLQAEIQVTDEEGNKSYEGCAVHEIGFICLEWGKDAEGFPVCVLQSDKWAVDILWYTEPLADFAPYEVWPKPCGVHTFAGCEWEYLKGYCERFPDSPHCVIPEELP